MPKHEIGLMQHEPMKGVRYDSYEPEKYNCISINDDFIEPLLAELSDIDCYWHSVDNPSKGLAYWGITLIPPEALDSIIDVINNITELSLLRNCC